jgi:hypothetical protein
VAVRMRSRCTGNRTSRRTRHRTRNRTSRALPPTTN